jgi:uncharacterized repeat protein (TIGR01451 family)
MIDSLPAGGVLVDAAGGTVVGTAITFTLSSLASGGTQQYAIRWALGNSGTFLNRASVSSSTADPDPANNTASATTEALAADVEVSLAAPAAVNSASNFDYTITVSNHGPGRATGIIVTSPVPSGATFVSASGGGTETSGVVTFPAIASLDLGANTVFTVTLTAPLLGGTLNMSATATSATADPVPANDTGNASTTVNMLAADVEVTLSRSADSVNVGDTITYTLNVKNNGPGPALGLTLTQTLDPNVSYATATVPPTSLTNQVLTWTSLFLNPGDQLNIEVKVTALAGASGLTVTSIANASALNDPDLSNNEKTVNTVVR